MKLRNFLLESENIEKVKQWISKNYSESKVTEMFDDEILNWLDDDWKEEGLDDEFEWYNEYGHGEAEDVVIDSIIKLASKAIKVKLSANEERQLSGWIPEKYDFLKYG